MYFVLCILSSNGDTKNKMYNVDFCTSMDYKVLTKLWLV